MSVSLLPSLLTSEHEFAMPGLLHGALPPPGVWHYHGQAKRTDERANLGIDLVSTHVSAVPLRHQRTTDNPDVTVLMCCMLH